MFMKKKNLYAAAFCLLLAASAPSWQGCGAKKEAGDPFGAYVSDAVFFRAVGQGTDADMQRARSKALHNAKVEIARSAHSVCRMVVMDYLDQTGRNDSISLRERFVSVSMESVNRSLVNVETEEVAYRKERDGLYTCYAKVKVERGNVLDAFAGSMEEKTDLDAVLFRQVVDKVETELSRKP
jgi:hypothetical protein